MGFISGEVEGRGGGLMNTFVSKKWAFYIEVWGVITWNWGFNVESKVCDVTLESNAYRTKWREKQSERSKDPGTQFGTKMAGKQSTCACQCKKWCSQRA